MHASAPKISHGAAASVCCSGGFAGFFGCVGGFEYGGGRLCSGENGSRMSISVALLLCTEVVIVAEEDVGGEVFRCH
jgi:hypothetical protein